MSGDGLPSDSEAPDKGLIVTVVMWFVGGRCSPDNEITWEKTLLSCKLEQGVDRVGKENWKQGIKNFFVSGEISFSRS